MTNCILDQAIRCQAKPPFGPLGRSFQKIQLSTGFLTFRQRKATSTSGKKGIRTECVATVTFTPSCTYNPTYMIIASEYGSRFSTRQHVSSISYLAINPILPPTSRVFELVEDGDLGALREMLQNGEASLRDTDTDGRSLLFVSHLSIHTH